MAVDTVRRVKKTASRLEHALLLQPITTAMSYGSSNHIPEINAQLADTNAMRIPAEHLESKPTLTGQNSITQSQPQSSKKRRSSKSKVPSELRRSTSTPHMRNLALGNSGELSPTSNKPRNKLGYHRTSVACGHCRRRKIRCLLAPDDPQSRCANCIRLKKDCNFYPVEHNPDGTQLPHIVGTTDSTPGQSSTPATTSPRHALSASGEKMADFRAPFHAPSSTAPSASYEFQGDSELDTNQGSNASRMPVQQSSYPYPHPIETQWPPAASFLPSSTIAESPSSSTSHWRQSPSTANSAYGSESNVSGGHTPAAMSTSSTMSYGHPDSHSWGGQPPFQPPTRSMSYGGHIEPSSQSYSNQGLGIQHHDFPRRSSPYPYPSSIDTNPSTVHATTVGGSSSGPFSAPIVPNHSFYPPTPTWNYEGVQNQAPQMQAPGRSMSMQWSYAEPGHLDRVQEETGPPIGYNQHGIQQFYSGA